MYDIVFISYQEPNADENFTKLKERFPIVKRVHGVKGLHQAHINAAKKCFTNMFWVVDADAIILDNFNFEYNVPSHQLDHVHVWRTQNPINDLVYGYGGVKLLPRKLTIKSEDVSVVLSGASGGAPTEGATTGIKSGTITTGGSSAFVSNVASGSANRSLGLTTATEPESARVTGPIKGVLGLRVVADVSLVGLISGTITTGGSSPFVSNVASGTSWFLGLTTATESARVTDPTNLVLGSRLVVGERVFSGGTVGEGLVTVVLAPDGKPPAAGVISTEGSTAFVSNVASGASGGAPTEGPNTGIKGGAITVGELVVGARAGASVVVTGARLVVGGRVFSGGKVVLGGGVAIIHI